MLSSFSSSQLPFQIAHHHGISVWDSTFVVKPQPFLFISISFHSQFPYCLTLYDNAVGNLLLNQQPINKTSQYFSHNSVTRQLIFHAIYSCNIFIQHNPCCEETASKLHCITMLWTLHNYVCSLI
jgi:hypothetical protein